MNTVGGRKVLSVAAFREVILHIWLVGRTKITSFEANLGLDRCSLVYHILSFLLFPLTETLLTGTLNFNSIFQSNNQSINSNTY